MNVSTTMASPVGELTLIASDTGLRAVLWPQERRQHGSWPDDAIERPDHPVLVAAMSQLHQYFAGARRAFDLPLDLHGTDFQRKAWRALATIPFGSTVAYGEQAARLGDARKARAVGAANGRNPVSIVLPCHRVVGANGSLTGFAAGLETKRWLLDHESRVVRGLAPARPLSLR